ncbi:MAG: DUF2147 domain-containing protein [Paracoccaceae bacterium]
MRLFSTTLCAIFVTASIGLADPIFGTWQTSQDDNGNFGHIEVSACDQNICGVLKKSFNAEGKAIESKNTGTRIIWGMVNKGGGKYGDGKIYSPDRDKTYGSKLALNGDSLKVSGCIAFICRDGGTWVRVK